LGLFIVIWCSDFYDNGGMVMPSGKRKKPQPRPQPSKK